MPVFEQIVDCEFELFCDSCGAGICNNAEMRKSRSRGMAQFIVKPCTCRTEEIARLEEINRLLELRIEDAEI